MIVIYENQINNIDIYYDLLDYRLEEYRFIITKSINEIEKVGFFIAVNINCSFYTFALEEVIEALEDLTNGLISLASDAGFWEIEIQTKNIIDTDWLTAYKDVLFINIT